MRVNDRGESNGQLWIAMDFVDGTTQPACCETVPDDLALGDGTNYLPRPKSDGGWFAGAVKRAKVERITPHALRHTAASLAISAGANVPAVSRMLGKKAGR